MAAISLVCRIFFDRIIPVIVRTGITTKSVKISIEK